MTELLDPRQCWRTPPELWEKINKEFNFYMDVAADRESALCPEWFGPDHPIPECKDGLAANWAFRCYCNPGFSRMGDWLRKAHYEVRVREGGCYLAVVMAHVQTSAKWFSEWAMRADEIVFLTPRVQFIPADGIPASSNSRDNMLVVYRKSLCEPPRPRFSVWNWRDAT